MIVIPDAPAYLCDVCGHKCFNDDFLYTVHYLLRQAITGTQRASHRRQRAKLIEGGEWQVASDKGGATGN
jgi:hypothetical protein